MPPKPTKHRLPVLISYHYLRDQSARVVKETVTNPNFELLIDSGAFTALNAGYEINLDEYIEFCHKWEKHLFGYMALDKLQDPKTTDRNLKVMQAAGLKPIPVHVLGDDGRRMDQLFEQSDIVALGGLRRPHRGPAPASYVKQKMIWAKGRKVHWLGYTAQEMLEAFRPFSCDCSNWASGMVWGLVTLYYGGGRWANLRRKRVFDKRLHEHRELKQALAFYDIPLKDFLDERHWHNGNSKAGLRPQECMITKLPARSWVRYSLDFKRRFGVRVFLACHDSQVSWLDHAYAFMAAKGVADV